MNRLQVLTALDRETMLTDLGVENAEAFFGHIPTKFKRDGEMDLPPPMSEAQLVRHMNCLANSNVNALDFDYYLGAGCYDHHVPSVIDVIAARGEFLTSYTPYQPEISQGLLKALDIFARSMASLAGLPVVTSSHYDCATALAEACWMAVRSKDRKTVLVSPMLFPHYRRILETYCWGRSVNIVDLEINPLDSKVIIPADVDQKNVAAILCQSPNCYGVIEDVATFFALAEKLDACLIGALNPYLQALGPSAGDLGFDIAVFEGQCFGLHMFAGGAHIGILACKAGLKPFTPGRLVGTVSDLHGRPALALVFEDREQHVARDRATSNICSNQALHAIRVGAFITLCGVDGLHEIAQKSARGAYALKAALGALSVTSLPYEGMNFNEFIVDFGTEERKNAVLLHGATEKVFAGLGQDKLPYLNSAQLLISVTETKTDDHLRRYIELVSDALSIPSDCAITCLDQALKCRDFESSLATACGGGVDMKRLQNDLPATSEVDLVRQYTNLSRDNFGVDTGAYPLGSCTMKYNPKRNDAVAEVPGFQALHPLQPLSTMPGLKAIYDDLRGYLAEITGLDKIDLTPAAGAHGELKGLLIARKYFEDRSENQRTIVIIPDSAHGTNPASASMVGYSTEIIPTRHDGLLDVDALAKVVSNKTAVLMLTNPSTFGLFENEIEKIVDLVHGVGGLVYYDGANMNALMGHSSPGHMGFDIAHINVHKTLGTPHGGGGPGSGPTGVKAFLAKYVSDGLLGEAAASSLPIKLFAGHISVLLRAYAYILSLGANGLKRATEDAVLNANYLAHRLSGIAPKFFDVTCMHEVLLDGSLLPCSTLDLAKRMIDFGIHPPTLVGAGCVYFGEAMSRAMLFEPTETETKATLDLIAETIAAIVKEAAEKPDFVSRAPYTTATPRIVY